MLRRVALLTMLATLGASTPRAFANGRFPAANQLLVSPTDPNEIIVRVSFGLLVSRDGGKKFGWVCEQALGLGEAEDPMYTYASAKSAGRIVGSTYQGVLVSSDRACSWPKVQSLAGKLFIDLTQRSAERERIVVLESSYDKPAADGGGGSLFNSQLWESPDDATTFNIVGARINPQLVGYTVDLAPSDRDRIYVTGSQRLGTDNYRGALLASTNHGAIWTEHSIALEPTERSVYIAAVDPTNPDRLYGRTHGAADKPTRLLLSDDGGATFRTIFRSSTPLLGFALSSDGSKLYVGSPTDGLHVAATADLIFRKTSSVEVQCITIAPPDNRIWVCSAETSGFIVAYSRDDGASFEGKTHFSDITGPLDCPPTPPFDQCVKAWPAQRAALGLDRQDGGTDDAGIVTLPASRTLSARGSGCSSANIDRETSAAAVVLLGCGLALTATALRARRRRR